MASRRRRRRTGKRGSQLLERRVNKFRLTQLDPRRSAAQSIHAHDACQPKAGSRKDLSPRPRTSRVSLRARVSQSNLVPRNRRRRSHARSMHPDAGQCGSTLYLTSSQSAHLLQQGPDAIASMCCRPESGSVDHSCLLPRRVSVVRADPGCVGSSRSSEA